jgi:hypothetical protein
MDTTIYSPLLSPLGEGEPKETTNTSNAGGASSGSVAILTPLETTALLQSIPTPCDQALFQILVNEGLFLGEVLQLHTFSVLWSCQSLSVHGKRSRAVPLSPSSFTAIQNYIQARGRQLDTKLFPFTERTVQNKLKKHAKAAGIAKVVNIHTLRNSAAVNYCKTNLPIAQIAQARGVSHHSYLKRYQVPKLEQQPLFIGRQNLVGQILQHLNQTPPISVLLTGASGIGKSALLQHCLPKLLPNALFVESPTPTKNMLILILKNLEPQYKPKMVEQNFGTPFTNKDLLQFLKQVLKGLPTPPILIVDNLNTLKTAELAVLKKLLDGFCILGATSKPTPKLSELWWAHATVSVPPLILEESKALIDAVKSNINIKDTAMLHTKLISMSGGNPLVILQSLQKLSQNPTITPNHIRNLQHDGGKHYRDWTPVIPILWSVLIFSRFLALGSHNFEGYILAGFGISMLMLLKFFVQKAGKG